MAEHLVQPSDLLRAQSSFDLLQLPTALNGSLLLSVAPPVSDKLRLKWDRNPGGADSGKWLDTDKRTKIG
jgi:hypothetical protein